ncbi:hypothetical protein RHMOL_Rhmol08G0008100 [Rhododendron molle]|uniref:Uncharacterized protein n=1 Tax=Rhododendron molle TaxID=49168 RepID=A0ACC0MI78_RHOML|nr:hypothetical protein RHMOL_Rhmol08G0008100 [Rhododendron molle]
MKLRLLRVLDLEKLSFRRSPETGEIRLLDEIRKLIHLRHLGLRGTKIHQISSFIGNLHALQTLELSRKFTAVPVQLPDEICYAKQLRRLLGVFKWPFPVDNLTKLRTLRRVVVGDQMEFDPTVLINLRELWVSYLGSDRRITLDFYRWIEKPPILASRSSFRRLWFVLCIATAFSEPEPHPNDIVVQRSLEVLEKLPNLTVLGLGAYGGDKLACSAGGFPQLEILEVIGSSDGELEVEEGGMSMLKGLRMENFHLSNISGRLTSIPVAPAIDFYVRLY